MSSLSNDGDRALLLGNPQFLELSDVAVKERRTRVAVVDGCIVGFVSTLEHDAGIELEDLFVGPASMRRGVARALVADVVGTAVARGVRRVEVTANVHALGFYAAVGFVRDGEVPAASGTSTRT